MSISPDPAGDVATLRREVDRLTRELSAEKAAHAETVSAFMVADNDEIARLRHELTIPTTSAVLLAKRLAERTHELHEQRAIVAAVRKVVVARLCDAGAGMDLVTDIDAALGRLRARELGEESSTK